MDRVSESMMNEFAGERELIGLPEDDRFEHFVSFITVGRHYSESFDTEDVVNEVVLFHRLSNAISLRK